MKFIDPLLFAIKKFEFNPFIRRTLTVFRNPDLEAYPETVYQYELIDFFKSLLLSELFLFGCFQSFSSFFEFDPFKVIKFFPWFIAESVNALLWATDIASLSILFHGISFGRLDKNLFKITFWRVIRLYSILNVFLMTSIIISINNVLKFGEPYYPSKPIELIHQLILLLPLTYVGSKLLILPLYKILKKSNKRTAIFELAAILFLSYKASFLLQSYIPHGFIANEEELIKSEIIALSKHKHLNRISNCYRP